MAGEGKPTAMGVAELPHRESHLPQVARTVRPPSGTADRLHGRQEQTDEDADDGHHDEQFHEREPTRHPAGCPRRPIHIAILFLLQQYCIHKSTAERRRGKGCDGSGGGGSLR
jgi:hypothetical protein